MHLPLDAHLVVGWVAEELGGILEIALGDDGGGGDLAQRIEVRGAGGAGGAGDQRPRAPHSVTSINPITIHLHDHLDLVIRGTGEVVAEVSAASIVTFTGDPLQVVSEKLHVHTLSELIGDR